MVLFELNIAYCCIIKTLLSPVLFYEVLYCHRQFNLKASTHLRKLSSQTDEVDPGVLLSKVL